MIQTRRDYHRNNMILLISRDTSRDVIQKSARLKIDNNKKKKNKRQNERLERVVEFRR